MSTPSGWRALPLSAVASEVKGSMRPLGQKRYELWSVPSFASGSPEVVEGSEVGSAKRLVSAGDVLLCKINPRINRVWVVGPSRGLPQIASLEWIALRPSRDVVDPTFLKWILTAPPFRRFIEGIVQGVTGSHTRARSSQLMGHPIPIPPLEEQRRIVEILEGHLSRLDAANEYLLRAQSHLRRFRAARDDQLVWDQNASRKPIGMLLGEPMRNGHSARALSGDGPGVRTLTLTAITRRSFTDTYTKMTVANRDKVQDLWLKPGDVLVQRANTPELVGTSALYEGPEGWAIFPDLAIRLRANQAIIRPRYLALALQANKTHTALRGKAKGLAGSMPKIDQRAVAECEIPVPSLSAQDRILREAEGVHEVTDQLQREVVKSLKRSANLRRALLSAAFSGRSPADTEMGRFFIDGPSEQEVLAG